MSLKLILAVAAVSLIASGCTPPPKPTTIYSQWPFDAKEAAHRQGETAKALGVPKEITLDLGNEVKMKLVLIPAGKFIMGSPKSEEWRVENEGPQHEVTISKPFYIGIYTVTQEQYEQVMGKNPSFFKGKTNPVETVSWLDAVEFCKALSTKMGKTGKLPTEAQWEYACRAGTTTPFNTGNIIRTDDANYDGNYFYGNGSKGEYREKPMRVGSFRPNAWGLFDMHGNVSEWCQDWYESNYYANSPKIDPQGPVDGKERVMRGGSWAHTPAYCRSAVRCWVGPLFVGNCVGFRVVVLPDAAVGLVVSGCVPGKPSVVRPTSRPAPQSAITESAHVSARPPDEATTRPQQPAATQSAESSPEAELIRQLDDDRYKVREEATKKLTAMGGVVLPILDARIKENHPSLEAEARIATIMHDVAQRLGVSAEEAVAKGLASRTSVEKLRWYTAAVVLNPDYAEAFNNRGVAYIDRGQQDYAIVDFNKAIALLPNYAEAYGNRGVAYSKKGHYDIALKDFAQAIALKADYAEAYANRGGLYCETKRYEDAFRESSRAIELKPTYAPAFHNRGCAYERTGKITEAIADFTTAIGLDSQFSNPYYNRASLYHGKRMYAESIKDATKFIELEPANGNGYNVRGNDYAESGHYDQALKDLNRAIELQPKLALAYSNRSIVYKAQGKYENAMRDCDTAIAQDPTCILAYNSRGLLYYTLGKCDKAIENLSKAVEIKRDFFAGYANRGVIYQSMGQYDKAIADYTKAIEFKPDLVEGYCNRAMAYRMLKKYDASIADCDKAIEVRPDYALAYHTRGCSYLNKGKADKAMKDFDKTIELKPDYAEAYANRAVIENSTGKLEESVKDCSKAIELKLATALVCESRARAYYGLKQYDKAWADIEACRKKGGKPNPKLVALIAKAAGRSE